MAQGQDPRSEVTDKLSDILRRANNEPPLHKRSEAIMQPEGSTHLRSIIQRVSGASVAEIDALIAELQSLREYLVNEGQRIRRELTEYTRLNQGAMETTRVITASLLTTRTGPDRNQ